VFGGWKKVPTLNSPAVVAAGAKEAPGDKRKSTKRGKRKKNSMKVLRAVDTAAYLAKGGCCSVAVQFDTCCDCRSLQQKKCK